MRHGVMTFINLAAIYFYSFGLVSISVYLYMRGERKQEWHLLSLKNLPSKL